MALVGLLVLDWVSGHPLSDAAEAHQVALDRGIVSDAWGNYVRQYYMDWGALVLILLETVQLLAWTCGGVRGDKSAMMVLSTSAKKLRQGKLAGARVIMAFSGVLAVVAHLLAVLMLFDGDLGLVGVGGWVMLAGVAVLGAGGVVGPRLGGGTAILPGQPPRGPAMMSP